MNTDIYLRIAQQRPFGSCLLFISNNLSIEVLKMRYLIWKHIFNLLLSIFII